MWGNRVSPSPHPREGLGGRRPPRNKRMFIAAWCGGAAWRAEVTTVRRVLPPSQPPPAGGRSRVPAPGGEGSGRLPSPCPRSRDAGGPFASGVVRPANGAYAHAAPQPPSQPPPAGGRSRVPAPGGRRSGRGPAPRPRSRAGGGRPALPEGEGAALAQGDGETGFPQSPARGRVWEGAALPRRTYQPRAMASGRSSSQLGPLSTSTARGTSSSYTCSMTSATRRAAVSTSASGASRINSSCT